MESQNINTRDITGAQHLFPYGSVGGGSSVTANRNKNGMKYET